MDSPFLGGNYKPRYRWQRVKRVFYSIFSVEEDIIPPSETDDSRPSLPPSVEEIHSDAGTDGDVPRETPAASLPPALQNIFADMFVKGLELLSKDFLAADSSSKVINVCCLLIDIIQHFAPKMIKIEAVLEHYIQHEENRKGETKLAPMLTTVLAEKHFCEVVQFLLQQTFSTCEEYFLLS